MKSTKARPVLEDFLKKNRAAPRAPILYTVKGPSWLHRTAVTHTDPVLSDSCPPEMLAMETRRLCHALRYLRRIAAPSEGSRLDAELIERFVATRDGAAFGCLVERYGPLVLGVCRRVLGNHHDAEDAFQATFLVLARKARQIRQRDALAGWLYKVAYHLATKLRASAERRRHAERQPSPRQSDELQSDHHITWGDLRMVLDEELERLPEKYRAPLLLCCLAGRTRDEAAEQLGWSLGALKMRLERGRQLLRTRLSRRGLSVSAALLAMLLAQHGTASPAPAELATATIEASLLFAEGKTSAALSAQAVSLAGAAVSAGASKAKLLGAATVLLCVFGITIGSLSPSRIPDTSPPVDEPPVAVKAPPAVVSNRFANASEEWGLSAILNEHYARFPGWQPTGATLLDIDGDEQLDLHLAGQAEGLAALGRNIGGQFAYVDPRPEIPRGPRHKAELPYPGGQIRHAFDFNEDRKLDLAISWHNNGGALYHHVTSGALPFRRVEFVQPEFPDIRASALADVNRDGIVDFSPNPSPIIPAGLRCAGAIPVDLDGDGRLELIARQTEFNVPARRKIFRSHDGMKWTDVTREAGLSDVGSVHGVGDVNQDGHPDLICVEGQQIVIYVNDGKGRFVPKPEAVRTLERASRPPHPDYGAKWGGAVVLDLDNDGIPDILINGRFFLYVLRGAGDGTFDYVNDRWGIPDVAYCDVDDGLCFGDVNRDGRLDLVTASSHLNDERRPIGLFLSGLEEHHWLRVRLVGRSANASATGAKIRVHEAGNPERLIAYEQVAVWGRQSFHSYYAAVQTERHFGLGACAAVDVSVEFHPSGRRLERKNVPANGTIVIEEQSP
jgi:RNA polymerase sigma factor (sigma-70 family)